MKNLKKLTRKGLDELAKQMPEMKVAEQSECVGAYRIYSTNSDGTFGSSYKHGDSEEIRIMNPTQITNLEGETYKHWGLTEEEYMNNQSSDPTKHGSMPYNTIGTNPLAWGRDLQFHIFYKQVIEVVDHHGVDSGFILNTNAGFFSIHCLNDYRLELNLPGSQISGMYQTDFEYIIDGLNGFYDSGLIHFNSGMY